MAGEATILRIDHVQVTMPRGGEERARAFYGGALGLREVAKPVALAGRGGVWFACGEQAVHLGVEDAYAAQRKAHPAFLVADLAAVRERLVGGGGARSRRMCRCRDICAARRAIPSATGSNFCRHVAANGRGGGDDQAARAGELRARGGGVCDESVARVGRRSGAAGGAGGAEGDDFALDVSTGGGHTALALARSRDVWWRAT